MAAPMTSAAPRKRQRRALEKDNSLLGRFKTYVSSSLGLQKEIQEDDTNDFDEDRDDNGKRRRLTQDRVRVERENRQPKRLRLGSPDFHPKPPQPPTQPPGYLDPPASAYVPSPVKPSLSNGIALGSLSLADQGTPPPPAASVSRDASQPPTSFRLSQSRTPQPALNPVGVRDVTYPPSVSSLISNPIFVRPSSQGPDATRSLSRPPTETTLGMLAESTRRTRSPVRSRSVLMLDPPSSSPDPGLRKPTPAERALQTLDAYKTPLYPTRDRPPRVSKTEQPTSRVYDMFSRRTRKLELLKEERDKRRLENIGKPTIEKSTPKPPPESPRNDTKPYAGSGGLRKLLNRRREEDDTGTETPKAVEEAPSPAPAPAPAPVADKPPAPQAPLDNNWNTTSRASSQGSSLRVGRQKISRAHLSRPSRPTNKFSAQYDDDDEDEEERRRDEERELIKFAKNVPTFNIPAGFTFSKNTLSLQHDTLDSQQMPIPSLPFSIASKPPPVAEAADSVKLPDTGSLAPPPQFLQPMPAAEDLPPPQPAEEEVQEKVQTTAQESANQSSETIPNFFASSPSPLKVTPAEQVPTPVAPPSEPSQPPSSTTPAVTPQPERTTGPVVDVNSPFWVDKPVEKEEMPKPSLFSGFGTKDPVAPMSTSLFGPSQKAKVAKSLFGAPFEKVETPSQDDSSKKVDTTTPAPPVSLFTFPKQADPAPAPTPGFSFNKGPTAQNLFSFGDPKPVPAPTATPAPPPPAKPETSTTPTSLFKFGDVSTTPVGTPTSEPLKLAFSTSQTSVPKLIFDKPASSPLPFGETEKPKVEPTKPSSPFTFGSSPATPPPPPELKATFSLGQPTSTTPTAPAPFTFGVGSTTPSTASESKPFFGQPQTPTRPMTPPRDASRDEMMDESPSRDTPVQPSDRPAPIAPSFSFSSAPSTSFGQPQIQSSTSGQGGLFPFGGAPSGGGGGSSSFGNPFNAPQRDSSPFAFGGGSQLPQSSSGAPSTFGFGSQQENKEPQRPSTTGSFTFSPSTSTGSNSGAPAFAFSTSQQGGSGGFGQTSSTPNSPSSFHANISGSGLPFGGSTSSGGGSNPFQFSGGGGSQSTSPATSNPSSNPFMFGTGQSTQSSGTAAFTVGTAPAPNPAAAGGRPRKALPRRGKR